MSWKVPITSQVYKMFGKDHLARDLFIHLLLRANHTDEAIEVTVGYQSVRLERGQAIFGRSVFAKLLRASPSGTLATCQRLVRDSRVTAITTPYCTIITILNYEELTAFRQEKDRAETGQRQARDTYKEIRTKNKEINPKKKRTKKEMQHTDVQPPETAGLQLARYLFACIRHNNPNAKEPNLSKWGQEVDVMIHADNRDPPVIRDLILWCQADAFWKTNILSPSSLRRNFDKMYIRAKTDFEQKSVRKTAKLYSDTEY